MLPVRRAIGGLGNVLFKEAYIQSQLKKGLIPDVYLQSEEYFKDIKWEWRTFLRLDVVPNDYVVIHVRRGDYVGNPFYVDLMSTDYYSRAMDQFENARFIVISDNIEYCKQQDVFKNCEFSNGTELEDLNLMAGARGVIMANSSFSWWGGYLCDGKVIAPKTWHPDGITRTVLPDRFNVL